MPIARALAPALAAAMLLPACSKSPAPPAPAAGEEVHSDKPRDLAPQVAPADQAALVAGGNDFAVRLYRQLGGQPGNLAFSPLSISTALAMVYAGARGQTETQMASAFGYSLPQDRLHPAMNWLDLELASRAQDVPADGQGSPFELQVVNRLWGQKGSSFVPAFLDTLAESYGAGLYLLDFAAAADPARATINDWVAAETKGRVQELLPAGSIDPTTRLVLTNAVYFTASWQQPFPESQTAPLPFQPLAGAPVSVATMHKGDAHGCRYGTGDGYVVAELPYVGHKLAMTLIVPDAGRFAEIEATLTGERLATMLASLRDQALELYLPRFKVDAAVPVRDAIEALGLVDAFDPQKADFSGIDGAKDLIVSNILHKSFISVNEQGTEAAAATAVVIGPPSAPQYVTVKVDRPFVFLLRDRVTGAILFMGRVVNPSG